MSCPTSETLDLKKLRKEIYERMTKERLVEIALKKSEDIKILQEEVMALRQLVQIK